MEVDRLSRNKENSRKRKHSETESKTKHERTRQRSRSRKRSRSVSRKKDKSKKLDRKREIRRKSRDRSIPGGSGSKSRNESDDSGSDSDDGLPESVKEGLRRKEEERVKRRKEKEKMKAYETPEEKRARRLAKKEEKEKRKRQKMGWDAEHIAYTGSDNPFGDPNLLSKFVWKKKEESDRSKGGKYPDSESSAAESNPINAIMELEKVKKRRLERERERTLRQEAIVAERRDREKAYFVEWESQEDSFHLSQAKLRSTIRIQDGRAKPIDLLAKYVSTAEADQQLVVEMHDPQKFIEGLKMRDLEDLLEDIKVYMELEQGKNAEYWRDITIVVHDEIARLNSGGGGGGSSSASDVRQAMSDDRRGTLNANVANEVNKIFAGKSERELIKLKNSIENKLKNQTIIDTNYWESLLKKLVAHIARVRLQERHKETLRQKLFKLKHEQGVEQTKPLFPVEKKEELQSSFGSKNQQIESVPVPSTFAGSGIKQSSSSTFEEDEPNDCERYDSSRYSPRLLQPTDLPADTIFLDPEQELNKLQFARDKFLGTGSAEIDADKQLMQKAREGMVDDADENEFTTEHALNREYLWTDKYRPRKPRYFNRVHTGYEWNKYNQTHYDPENPPPKIVQGYKFNIFYPDLIDKRQTPRYTLQPIENEPDFVVLKFSSGPPYEDIAFKIVNREWEYGHRHGYKCQFSNDIFQLWFKFKIYKYRR